MLRLVAGAVLVAVVVVVTTAIVILLRDARPRNPSGPLLPPEREPAEPHAPGEDREDDRDVGSELGPGNHPDCVPRAAGQSNDRSKLTRRKGTRNSNHIRSGPLRVPVIFDPGSGEIPGRK